MDDAIDVMSWWNGWMCQGGMGMDGMTIWINGFLHLDN